MKGTGYPQEGILCNSFFSFPGCNKFFILFGICHSFSIFHIYLIQNYNNLPSFDTPQKLRKMQDDENNKEESFDELFEPNNVRHNYEDGYRRNSSPTQMQKDVPASIIASIPPGSTFDKHSPRPLRGF